MNKAQFLGILRHVLTAGGAILATTGMATEDTANHVAGAVLTLAAFGWSLWEKRAK